MPENQTDTVVAEAEEPARELRPDEPREFGTKLEDIFAQVMPTDEELAEKKGETETPVETPTPEPTIPAPKKVEPVKELEVADVPGLPSEIFGEKKVEAPVVEETELVKEEPPKELKGKVRENFQRLADEKFETAKRNRELEKRNKELESKVGEADPDTKARLQQAESELAQYKERIYRADVTLDPRFEAQFTIPKNQHLERAKSAYQQSGGDPKEIEAALAAGGEARASKLDEIYNGVTNKYLLGKIENAVAAIENIDGQISQVHENREAWLKQSHELEQVNRSKQTEQYLAEVKTGLDEGERYLQELGWEVFSRTSDPKAKYWNDQLDKIRESGEYLLTKVTDRKQMMIASLMASSAPVFRSMFLAQKTRADKLDALLKEYKNSDAGLGGETPTPTAHEQDDENLSMADAVLRNLRRGK